MAKRELTDPQGERWQVRRKWVPRKLRWRGKDRDLPEGLMDGAELLSLGDDLPVVGVIAAVIAALVFGIALVLFIVPALIFLLELLLVLALISLGVAGRVLFGRPWTVEAQRAGSDEAFEWKVRGWRASDAKVAEVADQLEAGLTPPDGLAIRPTR
jgi:hypothetical protein